MITDPTDTTADPSYLKTNFDNAVTDYNNLMGTGGFYQQDLKALASAILTMKSMNPGDALMYAATVVFGDVNRVNEDAVEKVADQENIMTAAKNYVSYLQGILNKGTGMTDKDAGYFVQATNDFENELNNLPADAVDPSLVTGMTGFLDDIKTAIINGSPAGPANNNVKQGDGAFDAATVFGVWVAWSTTAQKPVNVGGGGGQQVAASDINDVNSSMQSEGASVQAQNQTLTYAVNETTSNEQQYLAAWNSDIKGLTSLFSAINNNLRTAGN